MKRLFLQWIKIEWFSKFWGIYYGIKAKIEIGIYWKLKAAYFFLRLAVMTLRGKIIIITTILSQSSKYNYQYLDIIISKKPLSAENTYDEI